MKDRKFNNGRRKFISLMAASGAYMSLTGLKGGEMAGTDQASERKIHIFSKSMTWMSHDEMAALISESGAEGIELPLRPGGCVLPENAETELPRAFKAAQNHGLKMDMIVTSITGADEKHAESVVSTASSLGIKNYRFGYLPYDDKIGIWGSLQKYKLVFKKLEELNRKYNIHGAYQNHAGLRVGGPVWDIYELVKDFDPEYLGCQYDIRHATVEGGKSWPTSLNLLRPWIKSTIIKDFLWVKEGNKWNPAGVPIGEGMVNFDEYFALVKKYNIPGPMSIQLEYPPFERSEMKVTDTEKKRLFKEAMKKDIETLKAYRTKYQL